MNISLSKMDKLLMVFSFNATLLILLIGLFYFDMLDQDELVQFHFFLLLSPFVWTFFIPFIGKTSHKKYSITFVILVVLIIKIALITIFELIDFINDSAFFFPGQGDFYSFFDYSHNFIRGETTFVDVNGELYEAYYPPGTGFIWVFFSLINPMKSTYLYRLQILVFEAGNNYLIYKISRIPKLKIKEKIGRAGMILSFYSASYISVVDFFSKYDCLVILLTLLGVYFYFKEQYYLSGAILTFTGLTKLYPFVWILGILLYHMKKKQWKPFKAMLISSIAAGGVILGTTVILEGFKFFEVILGFDYQIHHIYALYALNTWYFLIYTGIPFVNLVPYGLLLISMVYYLVVKLEKIDLNFFIVSTAMILVFFPSVNSLYSHWYLPFILIGMLGGNIKKVKFIMFLEISAVMVELSFNAYAIYNGLWSDVYLDPAIPPRIDFVVWRLVNLGIFQVELILLIFPRRFERFFTNGGAGRIETVVPAAT
ncbi:MAG: hypothetical protein ACTSUE_25155 [Promethearchaeota archaeon]